VADAVPASTTHLHSGTSRPAPRGPQHDPFELAHRAQRDLKIEDALGKKSRKSVSPMCPDSSVTHVPDRLFSEPQPHLGFVFEVLMTKGNLELALFGNDEALSDLPDKHRDDQPGRGAT